MARAFKFGGDVATDLIPQVVNDMAEKDTLNVSTFRARYPELSDREFRLTFQRARDRLLVERGISLVSKGGGLYVQAATLKQKAHQVARHRRKAVRSLSRSVATLDSVLQRDQLSTDERKSFEARRNRAADLSLDTVTRQRRAARLNPGGT